MLLVISLLDEETAKKSKFVAFFQDKWRAVKRSIKNRDNELVSIHIVQDGDKPQAALDPSHSGQGSDDTCVADPSPVGESAFICSL